MHLIIGCPHLASHRIDSLTYLEMRRLRHDVVDQNEAYSNGFCRLVWPCVATVFIGCLKSIRIVGLKINHNTTIMHIPVTITVIATKSYRETKHAKCAEAWSRSLSSVGTLFSISNSICAVPCFLSIEVAYGMAFLFLLPPAAWSTGLDVIDNITFRFIVPLRLVLMYCLLYL